MSLAEHHMISLARQSGRNQKTLRMSSFHYLVISLPCGWPCNTLLQFIFRLHSHCSFIGQHQDCGHQDGWQPSQFQKRMKSMKASSELDEKQLGLPGGSLPRAGGRWT